MIENITYEITSVNEAQRCMEVLFRTTNQPDVLVAARMPFDGEDLSALVSSFAPIGYWEDLNKQVTPVTVGTTGTVTIPEVKTIEAVPTLEVV